MNKQMRHKCVKNKQVKTAFDFNVKSENKCFCFEGYSPIYSFTYKVVIYSVPHRKKLS